MKKNQQNAEDYVKIIVEDDLNRIIDEETTSHSDHFIEREYRIDDGAVIKYEWRGFPGNNPAESFNHRFSLKTPPKQNPDKLKPGVIKIIPHPTNGR